MISTRDRARRLAHPLPLEQINTWDLAPPKSTVAQHFVFMILGDCVSMREQIAKSYKFFRDKPVKLSLEDVGTMFGLTSTRIANVIEKWEKYQNECGPSGRPRLLDDNEWVQLSAFINKSYEDKAPVTISVITQFIADNFEKYMSDESVRHMLTYSGVFKTVMGIRTDAGRVECSTDAIDSWFAHMSQVLKASARAEFVVNVDETGFGGSEMDNNISCVVPVGHTGNTVLISNELKTKRATMVVTIAADGTALKPLMVVRRQSLDAELRELGYTHSKIHFSRSATGYITKKLFNEWAGQIYLPYIRQHRNDTGYTGPALLILDGCSCHDQNDINDLTRDDNVIVCFLHAHSSDQLQFLDLGIFAIMKREASATATNARLSVLTRQVIKCYNAWQVVTVPENIVSAFKRGGFSVSWNETEQGALVYIEERYADRVRHFQQIDEFLVKTPRKRSKLY